MEEPQPQFLNLNEAAKLLRLTRGRVYQLAQEGRIPAVQVGGVGKLLFKRTDLVATLRPKTASLVGPAHV